MKALIIFLFCSFAFAQEDFSDEDLEFIDNVQSQALPENDLSVEIEKKKQVNRDLIKEKVNRSLPRTGLRRLQDFDPDVDAKFIQEFQENLNSDIESVIQEVDKNNQRRYTQNELKAYELQLKEISESPIRLYQVMRGTNLIRISDNIVVYTTKHITVRAHTLTDQYHNKYIVDKSGKPVFRVHYNQLSSIAEVTNLHRAPYYYQELPKKIKVKKKDRKLSYELNFNLHTGLNSPNYSKDLMDNPKSFAPLYRFEMSWISQNNFLLRPGLSLMYETISGQFETSGNYQFKSLSIGPVFTTKPLWKNITLSFQARLSLYSQLELTKLQQSKELELKETAALISLEKDYKTNSLGHISFGLNFQRKWIDANAGDVILEVNNNSEYDDSIAISIGHKSLWP